MHTNANGQQTIHIYAFDVRTPIWTTTRTIQTFNLTAHHPKLNTQHPHCMESHILSTMASYIAECIPIGYALRTARTPTKRPTETNNLIRVDLVKRCILCGGQRSVHSVRPKYGTAKLAALLLRRCQHHVIAYIDIIGQLVCVRANCGQLGNNQSDIGEHIVNNDSCPSADSQLVAEPNAHMWMINCQNARIVNAIQRIVQFARGLGMFFIQHTHFSVRNPTIIAKLWHQPPKQHRHELSSPTLTLLLLAVYKRASDMTSLCVCSMCVYALCWTFVCVCWTFVCVCSMFACLLLLNSGSAECV